MFDRAAYANTCPQRANFIEWLPFKEGQSVVIPSTAKESVLDMLKAKKVQLQVMSPAHIEKLALNPGKGNLDFILLLGMEVDSTMLAGLMRKLQPEGRLVVHIYNRYGMSYFAGKPAGNNKYYAGIEGGQASKSTFYSLKGLERLLDEAGIAEYTRYYLDPDGDYATHIFSDAYLPKAGDIVNKLCNVTYDRLQMFDETLAFQQAIAEEMYPIFANDYLIVTGKTPEQGMVRYANDRAPKYQVKTEIYAAEGNWEVRKTALTPESDAHIRQMAQAYDILCTQYAGMFTIVPCIYKDGVVVSPFVKGTSLSELMKQALQKGDLEQVFTLFHTFLGKLRAGRQISFSNYDFVFGNILIDGDDWQIIDYEWTVSEYVPAEELAFRAAYCFSLEYPLFPLEDICQILNFSKRDVQRLIQKEWDYQQKVTDGEMSIHTLCDRYGGDIYTREALVRSLELSTEDQPVQIYEDSGRGFSEEQSYFVEHAMTGHDELELTLKVSVGMKALRIDPCQEPCVVQIKKLWWNGTEQYLDKQITTGGMKGKGSKNSYAEMVFATKDPNFTISLDKLVNVDGSQNELKLQLEIHKVSLQLANTLVKSMKRII